MNKPTLKQAAAALAALASLACLAIHPLSAHAADLELTVQNIGSEQGSIMVAVYAGADQWLKKPVAAVRQPVASLDGGKMTFVLKDLPEGELAISLFHDVNGNGRMDSNSMGIPMEPYAFSNDATAMFSAPKFEPASFKLPGIARMTITLN